MIGDMFNHGLKAKVAALCQALQPLVLDDIASETDEPESPNNWRWWPKAYGQPDASSAQNQRRCAYFSKVRRLVVEIDGIRQIYDTGEHRIMGFSQQNGELRFRSQLGTFGLAELRRVEA